MNRNKLVFLDTETTGTGPNARLCQVAYKFCGKECEGLFKPPVPIEIEAMCVSHITNKMVCDKDPFCDSKMHQELSELLKDNILVAHNAEFDIDMLRKENLEVGKFIDTYRIAKHLDEEDQIPRHNLQYLRYFFDLDVSEARAHDALGDVRVLEKVFDHYFKKLLETLKEEAKVFEEMFRLTSKPILIRKFRFGKYADQKVEDVVDIDPGYLEWLLSQKRDAIAQGTARHDDPDWVRTLEFFLKGSTI